jgi:hypothetical protein
MFSKDHRIHLILLASLGLAAAAAGVPARAADQSPFFGHWTVSEENPKFSKKGILYKSIDVAPCWNDFCGVSVADDGSCGPTLFRFLMSHANDEELEGHGKWGNEKKKIVISYFKPSDGEPYVMLALGEDDVDFTGREGSMPAFSTEYHVTGKAHCVAGALTN